MGTGDRVRVSRRESELALERLARSIAKASALGSLGF